MIELKTEWNTPVGDMSNMLYDAVAAHVYQKALREVVRRNPGCDTIEWYACCKAIQDRASTILAELLSGKGEV